MSEQTAEEKLRFIEAQQSMGMAEHHREVSAIVQLGRDTYGKQRFDESSQVVADVLGDKAVNLMALARGFDHPCEIIEHLAANETRLKNFAKMTPAQQGTELCRIESQMSPHGEVRTGGDPAWKDTAQRSGRVSDVEWSQNGGSNLSDSQWHAEFNRRSPERSKRVR